MLCRSLGESDGLFWQPAEFENVANPDFENLKHLQNPGHLPLTEASTREEKNIPQTPRPFLAGEKYLVNYQ